MHRHGHTAGQSGLVGLLLVGIFLLALSGAAEAQNLAQWQAERFGIFIHWGPSSVTGWGGSLGWAQDLYPVAIWPDYARQFQPSPLAIRNLVQLVGSSGAKYAVLTAQHHDGYCNWDTAASDFNCMNLGPGFDVVSEFADQCRGNGLGVGLYYSLADFYDARYVTGPDDDPEGWAAYLADVNQELRELLTGYGAVQVLWFDGMFPWRKDPADWQSDRIVALVRGLQPDVVMNNRSGGGMAGDFFSCENSYPNGICRAPWEVCLRIGPTWFYVDPEVRPALSSVGYRSTADLIRTLATVVSRGGNLLLGVAPDAAGNLRPEEVEPLLGLGTFLAANGPSIYGCGPGPWGLGEMGVVTAKPGAIYLHLFSWPGQTLFLPQPKTAIVSANLVHPEMSLGVRQIPGEGWELTGLPAGPPSPIDNVVRLVVAESPVLDWAQGPGTVPAGVAPATAPPGGCFTFRVRYRHPDGLPPERVQVRLWKPDGIRLYGSPFTMTSDGTSDWANGVVFSTAVPLSICGTYSYAFSASDGASAVTLPATGRQAGPEVNQLPVLNWTGGPETVTDGVGPDTGPPGAPFTFQVTYRHPGGLPAQWVHVRVWKPDGIRLLGSPFAMTSDGTSDWADGVVFSTAVPLSIRGTYSYAFTASDGVTAVTLPASGHQAGPEVNRPPVLNWTGGPGMVTDGVGPDSGPPSGFSFRIKYFDADGDPPDYVRVRVWRPDGVELADSPFRMVNAYGSTDWANGVIFRRQLNLARCGTYSYCFVASDGYSTVAMPLTGTQSGPIVSASQSGLTVAGVTGQQVGEAVALTYALSGPAEVEAEILNIAGRLIARIPAGEQEAGVRALRWNGRNQGGSLVPAGVYLVRLTVRAEGGAAASALCPVSIRR